MADLTRDSERIMGSSRAVLADNRAGGRHRRARSIGRQSARLKRVNILKRLRNILIAIAAIWIAGGIAGAVLSGIGIMGVVGIILASVAAVFIFGSYPKLKTPTRSDLTRSGNVRQLLGRTELWLEAQRPALPPPAAGLIDQLGVQLDGLGLQLEGLDQNHPKAREVRSLVGEQLPEIIDSYRRIPAQMRTETRSGSTPDQQLTQSLATISNEIESTTRQLAEGSLDNLAIKHRFLDTKFGTGADAAPQLEHRAKDI
ncbi:hypothetical protein [Qipengyuania sediminis]|uniref:hypothetical protein n=1 Tax=Qipengyuania sediminis TaxID=1532023 RepID=UPI00105A92CA|nr:hypothetical protein [Qipengyuania sediminis]